MARGHDGENAQRVEQGALERLDDLQSRDREVDLTVVDHANQAIGAALDESHFNLRMLPSVDREDRRHRRLEELRRRAHSEDAAPPAAKRDTALSQRLGLCEQAPAAYEHLATVGGKGDPPA